MQIVIDISEEEYATILGNAYVIRKRKKNTLEGAVLNGTLLPKGHGISLERVLRDIKTEVTNIKDYHVVDGGLYVRECDVVEIIYKYIKEKEKK